MSAAGSDVHVLVEGYDDRAFLKGLLPSFGWTDLAATPRTPKDAVDDYKRARSKHPGRGAFVFAEGDGEARRFLLLREVHGDGNLEKEGRALVADGSRRVVLVYDSDESASVAIETPAKRLPTVESREDGATLHRIYWTLPRSPEPGIPDKQTLERLVVAALCQVFPERRLEVSRWLESRSVPPAEEDAQKACAWSHLAGWFSKAGFEYFYQACWEEPETANALRALLSLPLSANPEIPTLLGAFERALK